MIIILDIKKYYSILETISILKLRDAIYETHLNKGKLIFIGNGASASLASHAATDFTKQAKISFDCF